MDLLADGWGYYLKEEEGIRSWEGSVAATVWVLTT